MEDLCDSRFAVKKFNREMLILILFLLLILIVTKSNISIFQNFVDVICFVYSYNMAVMIVQKYKFIENKRIIVLAVFFIVFGFFGLLRVIDNDMKISIASLLDFEVGKLEIIYSQYWNTIKTIIDLALALIYCKTYAFIMYSCINKPYIKLSKDIKNLNKQLLDRNNELQRVNKVIKRENIRRASTEKALKKNIQRYRTVLSLTPNSIILTKNSKIIFANKAALSILKAKSLKEIVGKNFLDFIQVDYREKVRDRINTTIKTGEVCPFLEEKYIALDGTETSVKATGTSIPYDRNVVISIARDITESKRAEKNEKRLEEALQYDKLRKDFFANLSHELRTPLNVIFTAVQMLHLKLDEIHTNGDDLNKYINMTEQNCYRLLKIINNLIDITKIDSGFLKVNIENHDIIRVVEDTTLSIAEYIKSKDIELIFDTEMEEKIIACDEEKISRVIINLLSNAVKFTKPGGNIFVNIYDKSDSILIRVKDTGVGISKAMHNIIFERFTQVNKQLTRDFNGSGIGLSIVKALIDMHEGKVWVESEPGKGSEFFISLPIKVLEGQADIKEYNLVKDKENVINIEFSDI